MLGRTVRKPVMFWTFLVLGVLAVVGAAAAAWRGEWPSAGGQLVVGVLCLSIPVRLLR